MNFSTTLLKLFIVFFLLSSGLLCTGNEAFAQSCNWSSGPNSNHQQVEGISAVVNDKMYIFYGFVGGTQVTNIVEEFNPNSGFNGQWTTKAQMIKPVTHTDAVVINNEIWLVGGFRGNHGGPPIDTIQIYNPSNNSWRLGPSLPEPHASGVSVLLGTKLHVFGGLKLDRTTGNPRHFVYDINKPWNGWDTLAPQPIPRNHVGGETMLGRIYVVGGQTSHDGPTPTEDRDFVEYYDPTTDSWHYASPLNVPRSHIEPGSFAMDGKVYVTGGNSTLGLRNDIISYDIESGAIGFLCSTPTYLFAPAAKVIGNKYIIAHGGQFSYTNPLNKVWTTPFTRVKRRELGFWPKNLNITLDANNTVTKNAFIYTVSDNATFNLNKWAKPSWINSISNSTSNTSPNGTELIFDINTAGLANGTYTFQLTATAFNFSPDTLTVTLNVAPVSLPVNLTAFSAVPDASSVRLNWSSETEANHDYYQVERRYEQEADFIEIGQVRGKGIVAGAADYQFNDNIDPQFSGEINYRLKMVDVNGGFNYSETRSVHTDLNKNQYHIYPNPVNDLLFIDVHAPGSQGSQIHLFDLSGRQVMAPIVQQSADGSFRYQLNTAEIQPGYYLLEIETETGSHTEKLIIQ